MAGGTISGLVIWLYVHFHVAIGHGGHDHSILLAPIFSENELIPDVIDVAPTQDLNVIYSNDVEVNFGETLTPTQVKDAPKLEWNADPDSFYTLIMSDPDAPSRKEPKNREWQHWTVVNIPGSDISKGDILAEYVGAGPPSGSGLHRYVFLIFKQSHSHDFDEPIKTNKNPDRAKFSTRKFAEKHGLGEPVAGNFFQAEYDDYVPTLYKQFGF